MPCEEHLPQQRIAPAVGLHHTTFARLRMPVYTWSQNVRRLDVSFLPRRLWPAGWGVAGKEGPEPPALASAQTEALLEGHATAAGSGGSCRMLCSVAFSGVMVSSARVVRRLAVGWVGVGGPAGGAPARLVGTTPHRRPATPC